MEVDQDNTASTAGLGSKLPERGAQVGDQRNPVRRIGPSPTGKHPRADRIQLLQGDRSTEDVYGSLSTAPSELLTKRR